MRVTVGVSVSQHGLVVHTLEVSVLRYVATIVVPRVTDVQYHLVESV